MLNLAVWSVSNHSVYQIFRVIIQMELNCGVSGKKKHREREREEELQPNTFPFVWSAKLHKSYQSNKIQCMLICLCAMCAPGST